MADFPKLTPAFTCSLNINPGLPVGPLSTGQNLVWVEITSGSLKSEPTYGVKVNAELFSGADWIHCDPSGKINRLDVRSLFKTDDGAILNFSYVGMIGVTDEIKDVLSGNGKARQTTAWGGCVTHKFIQTGDEKYKSLEDAVFVAVGRFVVNADESVTVEYKISQVVVQKLNLHAEVETFFS